MDRGSREVVKLFVGQIPKTLEEDGVREVFQEFGEIIEIVILRDRRSGIHQGCCFVKYGSVAAAQAAIQALHNQRSLPPLRNPLQVRFADSGSNTGERGQSNAENKLFVGGVPSGCGDKELRSLFSTYGEVQDVYILASKEGQRGCAFVRYAAQQSCTNAIDALHGKYAMKAGELPLVVRFADPPKSQRNPGMYGANARFPWPGAPPSWPAGPPPPGWPMPWGMGGAMGMGGYPPWLMPPGMSQPPGGGHYNYYSQYQQQPQQPSSAPPAYNGAAPPPPPPANEQHGGQPAQPPLPPPPQPASSPATSWTEHHTPEGLKYYYNNVSCQSSWECPAELRQGGTAQSASPAASQMPVSAAGSTAATAAFSSLAAPACALAPAMAALSMTSSPPVSMAMSQGIGLPMGGEHQQPIGGSTITSGGMSYSASNNSFSNGSIGSGLSGLPNKVNGRGEGLGQVLPGLGALGAGAVGGEVNGTILPSNFSEQELQSAFTSFGNITSCEKLPSR